MKRKVGGWRTEFETKTCKECGGRFVQKGTRKVYCQACRERMGDMIGERY